MAFMQGRPTVYAIDFGTSNSLLAAASADEVFAPAPLEPTGTDPTILRSLLYFPDEPGTVFFAAEALREYAERAMTGRFIRSIKKHLGSRSFSGTVIRERAVQLEDLVGAFLAEMRRRANEHFAVDVRAVVLGRPARFSMNDDDDRLAQDRLERAARQAGFETIDFCPEPIAAAGAFPADVRSGAHTVLVADLGGGTSDFTVLRMRDGRYEREDVLSLGGVPTAGDALDGGVMRHHVAAHFGAEVTFKIPGGNNVLTMPGQLMEALCSPGDITLLRDRDVMEFLDHVRAFSLGEDDKRRIDQLVVLVEDALGFEIFEVIEGAKRALTETHHTRFAYRYPPIEIDEEISRSDLNHATRRERARILEELDRSVELSGVGFEGIDAVCCTGGTARVPAIAEAITARFPNRPIIQMEHFHSVIQGLAQQARELARTQP